MNKEEVNIINQDKVVVNLSPGMERTEVILREGTAPEKLPELKPVKIEIRGTLGVVAEYLQKRTHVEEYEQKDCHVIVDREKIELLLVTNESDAYRRREISGKLSWNPRFLSWGINAEKTWTPAELAMHVKLNRAQFADKDTNMRLVTQLLNFTADVNQKIEQSVQENGNRNDQFVQVVNSNLPRSFTLCLPIFRGMQPETIEVETFAKVDGRNVEFALLSPGALSLMEETRNRVIDAELYEIRMIAPEIAILEV